MIGGEAKTEPLSQRVEAWKRSSVEAFERGSVRAWKRSSMEAFERGSVKALKRSAQRVQSNQASRADCGKAVAIGKSIQCRGATLQRSHASTLRCFHAPTL